MFSATPDYYDVLYGAKDYRSEVAELAAIIPERATSALDVGCAIGMHAEHLVDRFETTGVDVDPALIAIARRRVPRARFEVADAAALDLGRTFDVVLCMYGVIAYLRTAERMRAAVAAMARHTAKVLCIEPWYGSGVADANQARIAEGGGVTIARVARRTVRGREASIDAHFLIADEAGVRHASERHELGVFDADEIAACLDGFRVERRPFRDSPQGLLIATR